MLLDKVGQKFPGKLPACNGARTIRVRRTFPGLRKRRQVDALPEIIIQAVSAPKIILRRRLQEKRLPQSRLPVNRALKIRLPKFIQIFQFQFVQIHNSNLFFQAKS